jgi:TatD DNase family protein
MNIIDTHAHLDQVENLSQALEEARVANVEAVLAVGVDLAANKKNLEIQTLNPSPKIFVGLGLHPGNIESERIEETIQFIRENIQRAVVVGEIGLDFWYNWVRKSEEKKSEQRDVFRRQLELAKEFDKPAIVHSRGAWQECLEMVKGSGIRKAVFHWYSGPVDVLKEILSCGYFVSATPSLAFSPQAREAILFAPIEQTLIETDSPVFFKYPDGSAFHATPKDVWKTLEVYAKLKNIQEKEALEVLNKNARCLLGISGKEV